MQISGEKVLLKIQIHQPQERLDFFKLSLILFTKLNLDPLASGEARLYAKPLREVQYIFRSTSLRRGQTHISNYKYNKYTIQIHQPQERLDCKTADLTVFSDVIQIHQPQERLDLHRSYSHHQILRFRSTSLRRGQTFNHSAIKNPSLFRSTSLRRGQT